jgi:hypothetical protein
MLKRIALSGWGIVAASLAGDEHLSYAQGSSFLQSELLSATASLLVAIAALLIAIGALVLFVKLARLIDRLEDRFKE